jgi:hypothetical protein
MGRHRTAQDSYTGCAGQMAVQGEFLLRRCNVAVPVIDEGEDVFAFRTGQATVVRIQVKTANAEPLKEEGRFAAQVSVPLEQLRTTSDPELHYVFAVRLGEHWVDFVVISRHELGRLARGHGIGYVNRQAGELQLYLSFGPHSLVCSEHDFQLYRNAWQRLPLPVLSGPSPVAE